MRRRVSFLFSILFAALFGAAITFAWFIWAEWESKRKTPVRSPEVVLSDVEDVRGTLRAEGVFWFTGSRDDAFQIYNIIELLEPSLRPFIWQIDEFEGYAILSAGHPTFGGGANSMAEVEQVLISLTPTE